MLVTLTVYRVIIAIIISLNVIGALVALFFTNRSVHL